MSDEWLVIHSGREIRSVDDWLTYAPPKRGRAQWTHGRSAMENARAWVRGAAATLPEELRALLDSEPATTAFEPLYAMPELVTRLDEFRGEHRNHDLVVLGNAPGGRTVIGIEAKADERFGTGDLAAYADSSKKIPGSNVPDRIRRLVQALFGPEAVAGDAVAAPYGALQYQLLTALAGTLIEARRRWAEQAVLIVHEFVSQSVPELGYIGTSSKALARNASAFDDFVACLLGRPSPRGPVQLVGPLRAYGSAVVPADMPFFIGKARTDLGRQPALRRAADERAQGRVRQ